MAGPVYVLIAGYLALAGLRDPLTPIDGLDIIEAELNQVYSQLGVAEKWRLKRYDAGHRETAEGRKEVLAVLKEYL